MIYWRFLVFIYKRNPMKLFKTIFKLFKKKKKPVQRKFGWKHDPEDHRDLKFKVSAPRDLPSLIDLRKQCPPVYDQGQTGSCTANALNAAYQFEEMKQGKENFMPSRLFVYYNERAIEGTINEDAGAAIRDGIKTLVKDGVCPETMWKYNENKFATKPTQDCYDAALNNQVLKYLSINPSIQEIKHCLVEGFPVVFGFNVYESFMSQEVAETGVAQMPSAGEQQNGGHAIMCVGYDDSKEALIIRNSWGTNWGLNGYFYMPYGYITNGLSADFWTIRLVE